MTEVVWAILQQNDRLLLAQRSLSDIAGGTWVFPGGKIDQNDTTHITAIHRELKEEVGLDGKRFRQLCQIHQNQYHTKVFLCDKWDGIPKPTCNDIIGVGWFTYAEMYALDQSLAPFVNENLSYLLYLIQHYDHHPGEWHEQWERCDEHG